MYGIDFGTSNTVVTTGDEMRSQLLDLDDGPVLPSLLFFERDKLVSIGQQARHDYADALGRYRGRRDLYNHFRFFQALKLALKDPTFKGTSVFGNFISAEALVGMYLRELRRRADRASGQASSAVVLGRPVLLGSTGPEGEGVILDRYRAACQRAGFQEVRFVSEPIAAAASLIGSERGLALVFDFGGGTLDISITRINADSIDILAASGRDLGGYVLNEDLSRSRIIRHFGADGTFRSMKGTWLDMPRWITDQVASFYALPLSDLAATRRTIKDLLPDVRHTDRARLQGLMVLLDQNLSFRLFEQIDEAKIELSSVKETCINFDVAPFINIHEPVQQADFEGIITRRVAEARDLVLSTLSMAGLEAADVSSVIRVGGSSRIPSFISMLESLFPGRVRAGAIFTSIASGLLAADKLGLSAA
jgi:hypothetical chaperone protein